MEHYHITVQMISHPSDPRPDTFREGGGLSHSLDHRWIPAPLGSNLKRERDICQTVARESASPELRVNHTDCIPVFNVQIRRSHGADVHGGLSYFNGDSPGACLNTYAILSSKWHRGLGHRNVSRNLLDESLRCKSTLNGNVPKAALPIKPDLEAHLYSFPELAKFRI